MILAGNEDFNKLFLLIFIGAVVISAIITCIKIFGKDKKVERDNEKLMHDENVLDDETTIIKKK
jgi:hypothetical protein